MVSEKGKTTANNTITAILCGVAVMALISVMLICIAPLLILNGSLSPNSKIILAIFIQLISSLVGSMIAGVMVRHNVWPVIASSGLFYLILICCAMLFFNGISNQFLCGLLGCGGGAFISVCILHRNHITQKKKIKKRRYR